MTASNELKKTDFKGVSIGNNLLKFPSKVIQISNICNISPYRINAKERLNWKAATALVFVGIIALLAAAENENIWVLFLSVICFCIAFSKIDTKKYGILIETNNQSKHFIVVKSQAFSRKLYNLIAENMSNPLSQSVYIDKSLNVNGGDTIHGDSYRDIQGSNTINNRNQQRG